MGIDNLLVFLTFCLASSSSQKTGRNFIGIRKVPGPGNIFQQRARKIPLGGTGFLKNEREGFDGHVGQAVFRSSVGGKISTGESFPRASGFVGFTENLEKNFLDGPTSSIDPKKLARISSGGFQIPAIHTQTFNGGALSHGTSVVGGSNGVILGDSKIGSGKLKNGFSRSLNPATNDLVTAFQEVDLNGLSITGSSGGLLGTGVNRFKSEAQGSGTNDLGSLRFSLSNPEPGLNTLDPRLPINIQGGLTDLDLTGIDPREIDFNIGDPILSQIGAGSVGEVLNDLDLAGIGPQDIPGPFENTRTPGLSGFGPLDIREPFREPSFPPPGLENTNANLVGAIKPGDFLDFKNELETFQPGGLGRQVKINGGVTVQRHSTPKNVKFQDIEFKPLLGDDKGKGHDLNSLFFPSPLVDHKVDYHKNLYRPISQGAVKKPHRTISHSTTNIGLSYNSVKIPSGYHAPKAHAPSTHPHRATTSYHKKEPLARGHQSFNIGSVDHKYWK